MKFLIATNHSYMLYRFRKELIEELLQQGEVVISMPFVGHEDDFEKMGCKCIKTEIDRRGMNPVTDFNLLINYFKLLKIEKPDKLVTYSIKPNIYASIAAKFSKIPYYANIQGLGTAFQSEKRAKLVSLMYKFALNKAKCVFFENQANADYIVQRNIVKKENSKVLNGAGINLDTFKYTPYPETDASEFLFVGRIMKEKGVDELFECATKLKAEFGEKVKFTVVGFFEDEYKEKVEELHKQGIINFEGFQTDTIPFYKKCSCVVLPSYHEGLSNVLLEASAIGRPVITSDIPGCKEAVNDGETGLLAQVQNTESLYVQMKKFIELTNDKKADMGKKAREKMENEFDKKLVVKETMRLIG